MKSTFAYPLIAVVCAAAIWVATARGGASLENITQAVKTLENASTSDTEQAAVADLSDTLDGKSFRLIAVRTDGTEANFNEVTDTGSIQYLKLVITDSGSEVRLGPWTPQDANNYYALFLE